MINQYRNVFIYVFAMFQEVSLSIEYCGSHWCFNGRCCFDSCCPELPQVPETEPFVIPVAIFGAFGGFIFSLAAGMICYKICKKSRASQPQVPTRSQPIPPPPPPPAPLGPTAPSLILPSDPPPYSEVIGKSDFFPVPVGQPPCYDNIAMEDLSSVENAQPPGSRLTD